MSKNETNDLCYILNEKNKYITKEYVQNTLKKFGVDIKINNLIIFQEAMIHLSYLIRDENFYKNNKTKPYQIQSNDIEPLDDIAKAIPLQKKSYERLEFLGDAIIHAILADYLFNRYGTENEGFMTKLRTKIENGDTLSTLSRSIGLGEYVIISRYVEKNGGRDKNNNILEDTFEAFMGSLFLEAGFEICKTFVISLIEKEIDLSQLLYQETNFKEKLLQFFHLRKWLDPIYGTLDISGPENKKMYTMYVKCRKNQQDEGEIVGIGVGTSKRKGEQNASHEALKHYGIYQEESQEGDDFYEELSDNENDIMDNQKAVNNLDDSLSDYESEDEVIEVQPDTHKCISCKKEFKKEHLLNKHISNCKNRN